MSKFLNRVKGMNQRAMIVAGGSIGIVLFALALVFVSANREEVVAVNAMAISTGGGGTQVTVSPDIYNQSAVQNPSVDTVDYAQVAQGGDVEDIWETAAQQPALVQGVPNQAAYDPETGILGGDPSTDTQAGGSVPDWATNLTLQEGGGSWSPPVDVSTPNDTGGGIDGVTYTVASENGLIAICDGTPCEAISIFYHDTPPPHPLTYTVTNLDGDVTEHEAIK